jgi:ABC-type transporter Mla subunit MlaD
MKGKGADFYIGLFVLAGLCAIGYMILRFGGMATRSRYEITVLFDSVEGLIDEAPVYYAGVKCGTVGKIIGYGRPLEDKPDVRKDKVKVILSLDEDTTLRAADEVKVTAVSLLGEKAVQIVPGPLDKPSLPKDGSVIIVGANPTGLLEPITEIVGPVAEVMENIGRYTGEEGVLTETIEGLNVLVKETLPSVVVDVRSSVTTLSQEVESLLKENRGYISELIESVNETVKSSSDLVNNLKQLTSEEGPITQTVKELTGAVDGFRRITHVLYPVVESVRAGKGGLGKFINDPTWYDNFSKLLIAMRKYPITRWNEAYEEEQRSDRRSRQEATVWRR